MPEANYNNGTVNFALRLPSDDVYFGGDSRAYSLENPQSYQDRCRKVQIIGKFFILTSGQGEYSSNILDLVRANEAVQRPITLEAFKEIISWEINLSKMSPTWKDIAKAKGVPVVPQNAFIIGCVDASFNKVKGICEFKERRFITLYSYKLTEEPSDVLAVAGDALPCRAIVNHLKDVKWEKTTSYSSVRRKLVEAMAHGFRTSANVGGPVELFSIRPDINSIGQIIYHQRHELIVPEIFFAEYGINFESRGSIAVDVSDEWLVSNGIERETVGTQVCAAPYSHPVQDLLSMRYHIHEGKLKPLTGHAISRDLFE